MSTTEITTTTMHAVVSTPATEAGSPNGLELHEVPRPSPLPTEVLVRVHAAGVNPVDWQSLEGKGMSAVLGEPPFGLGWDVSGVVEAVGWGVTTLAPGDEVYGMPWFPRAAGAYAEYVTAPSRQFAAKPTSIDHAHAAALPLAALTAWQALVDTAGLQAGQRVFIHAGAGGVGHLAVQIAHDLGAHVATTASAGNHDWLTSLGADQVIDYTSERFEDLLSDIDVVFDLAGNAEQQTSLRSLDTLRDAGLLICPKGSTPELAESAAARGIRVADLLVEPDGAALARIAELVDAGRLEVELAQTFPLVKAADALALSAEGHVRGKLVLRVD